MRSVILVLVVVLHLLFPPVAGAQLPVLSDLLPNPASIGNGVVVTDEGARTLDDIAGTFADPAEAWERLSDWGWQEHRYRYFESSDPAASLTTVEVSLHRFSSIQNAAAALPYFLDARAAALEIKETPVVLDRSQARGITGEVAEGREATIYVLLDTILARVTAISATDDPLPYAEAATQLVVDQFFISTRAEPDARPSAPAVAVPSVTSRTQDAATSIADCERAIRSTVVLLVQMPGNFVSSVIWTWKYGDISYFNFDIPPDCALPENPPVEIKDGPVSGICLWWNPQTSAVTGGPIATSSGGAPMSIGEHWECYSIYSGWFNRFYPIP